MEMLGLLLEAVLDFTGGQEAILIITAAEIDAIAHPGGTPNGEMSLSASTRIATFYPGVEEIHVPRDQIDPVMSEDNCLMVLPLPAGKVVVREPDKDKLAVSEQNLTLTILADLIAGLLDNLAEMADIRKTVESLQRIHKQLLQTNNTLRERTMIDELTGLHNRRFFERSLAYEIERFIRYGHPIGVVLFDIDHFKKVNDTHGHLVGDQALRHLAEVTKDTIRRADILARYGGEEFVVLLPDTGFDGSIIMAERLRAAVESSPLGFDGGQLTMTISAGVSAVDKDTGRQVDDVIRIVDEALYRAKEEGRNRVVATR